MIDIIALRDPNKTVFAKVAFEKAYSPIVKYGAEPSYAKAAIALKQVTTAQLADFAASKQLTSSSYLQLLATQSSQAALTEKSIAGYSEYLTSEVGATYFPPYRSKPISR